jgi:hypothetical protein
MASYNEFKNQVLGKGFDLDGAFGAQCWDGYAKYCQYLGYGYANCTTSGYVKDIWTNRKSNGTLDNFTEVEILQPGDLVVFKVDKTWTPSSHIAIFDHDVDGTYGYFLGQNQGAANGVFNLTKLPYSATYATAFRPKKFTTTTTATSGETWDFNGTLDVGDTVKSKSLSFTGLSASLQEAYIPDLQNWVPLSYISEASDTGDGKCDNYLANTNAKVYLDPCTVQAIDIPNNKVMVHNIWISADPLAKKV